jgi:hypothetical protein
VSFSELIGPDGIWENPTLGADKLKAITNAYFADWFNTPPNFGVIEPVDSDPKQDPINRRHIP